MNRMFSTHESSENAKNLIGKFERLETIRRHTSKWEDY
jgi:hypothetical protein